MGRGLFKERVVQLVTPKAVSAAMAAWIMACKNLLPGDFL